MYNTVGEKKQQKKIYLHNMNQEHAVKELK